MATLIPSLGTCLSRMQAGEKRFAQRLEQKLEDDYLCWYDVPVGPMARHPDFIILHPRRGILILEIKDWRLETIQNIDKQGVDILTATGLKREINPFEQARQGAHAVADALKADPQLTISSGAKAGHLLFPWSCGVVLSHITRKQFDDAEMGGAIEPQRVVCADEMAESVDAEAFQQRLWNMFKFSFRAALSLPQINRIRWHLFQEVRISQRQGDLLGDSLPTLDLMRVMDLQQEQLARSLGEGHRVIHGVAGSGKTLILGYRAEHLAQLATKPILVLCYNESLAKRMARTMADKGLGAKVQTHHFHQWCHAQLVAYNAEFPKHTDDRDAFFADMVDCVIRGVERGQIPAAQYDAVLIDEGHDFRPEWLKLIVQMVDPRTNSLLVLYDDAQSIYGDEKRKKFSFKSVGIQAAGRTTILKVNYRNTDAILRFARDVAQGILRPHDADDDGVPLIPPQSAGRAGPEPQVINLPSLKDEAEFIAKRLMDTHRAGTPWRDMAIIYRDYHRDAKLIRSVLPKFGIPVVYFEDVTYAADEDMVTMITMHSCKGLEFPLVVIPGADRVQGANELPPQEAKLLYVAMTRATEELVVCGVANST